MQIESSRIRIGMVGGGPGAYIGETHRVAMRLDDRYSLLAGVFSRDAERSIVVVSLGLEHGVGLVKCSTRNGIWTLAILIWSGAASPAMPMS
jgi:hypothetical protein